MHGFARKYGVLWECSIYSPDTTDLFLLEESSLTETDIQLLIFPCVTYILAEDVEPTLNVSIRNLFCLTLALTCMPSRQVNYGKKGDPPSV